MVIKTNRGLRITTLVVILVASMPGFLRAAPLQDASKVSDDATIKKITMLFKAHCNRCHGEKKPGGMVRLDNLPFDLSAHSDIWFSVREQIDQELMPPDNPQRFPKADAKIIVQWIDKQFETFAPKLPNKGNLIPHELLFGKELPKGNVKGIGTQDAFNGKKPAPIDLALALSSALGNKKDDLIFQAAQKGELSTRGQVQLQVRRMLDDPNVENPRLLNFFREYFGYATATKIVKDKPVDFIHEPHTLVEDTDRLVLHVLKADKDVLREMLTTRVSFVNTAKNMNMQTRMEGLVRAVIHKPPDKNNKVQAGLESVYGVAEWPSTQPTLLPEGTRIGVLMQPSWLVAFSKNFDNDPVRRGLFVRERLLGGTVPGMPMGMVAKVSDEKHLPLRDRLKATREGQCLSCHRFMDDLGLPFENFDHFGRFRTKETVLDLEATAKNVDKNGKPPGTINHEVELNTKGLITYSGDAILNGPVNNPREMIQRLAKSDRVRQVFIRHTFRYFLGRNETLADAKTLQHLDKVYVDSHGSFKALVVALLSSDSFLTRSIFDNQLEQ